MLVSTDWISCDQRAFNPRIKDKPFFTDGCNHEDGSYVGSFTLPESGEAFDVYIFNEHNFNRQHVCIRYGQEDSNYYSPGTVLDLICHAMKTNMKVYKYAAQLIMDRCQAKFTRVF